MYCRVRGMDGWICWMPPRIKRPWWPRVFFFLFGVFLMMSGFSLRMYCRGSQGLEFSVFIPWPARAPPRRFMHVTQACLCRFGSRCIVPVCLVVCLSLPSQCAGSNFFEFRVAVGGSCSVSRRDVTLRKSNDVS